MLKIEALPAPLLRDPLTHHVEHAKLKLQLGYLNQDQQYANKLNTFSRYTFNARPA